MSNNKNEDQKVNPKPIPIDLDELLKQITPDNLHDPIDFCPPQGKEVW
ncbi:MAG TPA: hypothetical protein VKG79_06575 [Bryobacteraceae bacterium]|nr:hypothetical protein [Bryobacteraceae bacterium]